MIAGRLKSNLGGAAAGGAAVLNRAIVKSSVRFGWWGHHEGGMWHVARPAAFSKSQSSAGCLALMDATFGLQRLIQCQQVAGWALTAGVKGNKTFPATRRGREERSQFISEGRV